MLAVLGFYNWLLSAVAIPYRCVPYEPETQECDEEATGRFMVTARDISKHTKTIVTRVYGRCAFRRDVEYWYQKHNRKYKVIEARIVVIEARAEARRGDGSWLQYQNDDPFHTDIFDQSAAMIFPKLEYPYRQAEVCKFE